MSMQRFERGTDRVRPVENAKWALNWDNVVNQSGN